MNLRCAFILLLLAGCARKTSTEPVKVEWAADQPAMPAVAPSQPVADRAPAGPAGQPQWPQEAGGNNGAAPVPPSSGATAGTPGARPTTTPAAAPRAHEPPQVLAPGEGPAANPPAQPVDGHELLPVWDDAKGARPQATSLVWGESELVLNLYEPPRATPMQIEFSLNGGPWTAARYGRVEVPDLGVGTYQVRCVAWPTQGKTWVMDPIVLERTARGWQTK